MLLYCRFKPTQLSKSRKFRCSNCDRNVVTSIYISSLKRRWFFSIKASIPKTLFEIPLPLLPLKCGLQMTSSWNLIKTKRGQRVEHFWFEAIWNGCLQMFLQWLFFEWNLFRLNCGLTSDKSNKTENNFLFNSGSGPDSSYSLLNTYHKISSVRKMRTYVNIWQGNKCDGVQNVT